MLHFTTGSHAHRLITLLSVVGEYPMNSVCILGGVQVYKTLIRKMCEKQVVRFDDTVVALKTGQGLLTVRGEGLQLKNLSLEGGRMAVDGKIQGLFYEEPRTGGWLKGLFG